MARRAIEMIEVKEVLHQWQQGRGKKTIAKSLGLARNTVREIINQAEGFGFDRCEGDIDDIAAQLQAQRDRKPVKGNSVQSRIAGLHSQIEQWRDQEYMTVVQMVRLLAEQGEVISETSLRTYLKRHFPKNVTTTIRLETVAGQSAQVDFGYVGFLLDPKLGRERKCYAFVMTLSHSRHKFLRFVFSQDSATWIDCHVRAFDFFGGVPNTVILDNLKSGVIKPNIYDPTLNRAYADLERYYGFIADPAKVRTPQHKGKVERNIRTVKEQVIAGRDHQNVHEANQYALHWCRHEIAQRVVRTTGKTPWDLFISEDKPALKALPKQPFDNPHWQEAKVHNDQHIVYKGSFYSMPYIFVGEAVWVRGTERFIKIYCAEQLIKTHPTSQSPGQWITDQSDYPKYVKQFLEKDREGCFVEAQHLGDSVYRYITGFYVTESWTFRRKAHAVLRLAEVYGADRLNKACHYALTYDNDSYDSLLNILLNNYDQRIIETKRLMPLDSGYLRDPREFGPLH